MVPPLRDVFARPKPSQRSISRNGHISQSPFKSTDLGINLHNYSVGRNLRLMSSNVHPIIKKLCGLPSSVNIFQPDASFIVLSKGISVACLVANVFHCKSTAGEVGKIMFGWRYQSKLFTYDWVDSIVAMLRMFVVRIPFQSIKLFVSNVSLTHSSMAILPALNSKRRSIYAAFLHRRW